MARNREERNRVLGVPRGPDASAGTGEERQHVLGFPVDWFGPGAREWLRSLPRPVRRCTRQMRHRRPGPHAPEENEPEPGG